MEEPSTFEFPVSKNSPSATERVIAIVLAFPGEFDRGHTAPFTEPTVKTALHRDELKLAHAFPIELDEGRNNKIQVFAIPEFHLGDAPAPNERARFLRGCLLRCSSRHPTLDFSRGGASSHSSPTAANLC